MSGTTDHYQSCHTNIPVNDQRLSCRTCGNYYRSAASLYSVTNSVAKPFEKENGYQLLFLSAREVVLAYLTKRLLSNLKQDIKAILPPDYNPFYAGFWNRDTYELGDMKIGIPKGKNITIINPKGKVD